jgi:CBS domain-containing protein
MKQNGGSLPIVAADTGVLVGNFSASDVAKLFHDEKPNFATKLTPFLEKYGAALADVRRVCVSPDSTLAQAAECMVVRLLW